MYTHIHTHARTQTHKSIHAHTHTHLAIWWYSKRSDSVFVLETQVSIHNYFSNMIHYILLLPNAMLLDQFLHSLLSHLVHMQVPRDPHLDSTDKNCSSVIITYSKLNLLRQFFHQYRESLSYRPVHNYNYYYITSQLVYYILTLILAWLILLQLF